MQTQHILGSLIVAAVLLTPTLGQAAPAPQVHAAVTIRVYDSSHKEYHAWDDQEDHAYRQYLTEHHMKYRRYSALSHKQQTAYWNSRRQDGGRK